ncbi:MAG TPA: NADH-ubiquinone oxidoreductase-F iron-sulfur binding region domain-containing protein [Streptosporangiaceae bacterium]|nr:NADH-ubiquinone oxidoreductase-F iron-sulfur binding region domain-containing protein [Streptosporangiaceae bacterium]
MNSTVPEAMRIGRARLTAGLDRFERIDLATHQEIFGPMRRVTARQLIEMVESVDMRGRGGAAFPFARKIRAVADSCAQRKCRPFILINGTEGEPGSAKDKMLLLRSPYLVLGGALLAARALNAKLIIVGVTNSAAASSVAEAVRAEPDLKKVVRVVEVPERFVAGEGGALVNAVNGKIPLPPGKKRRASDSGVDGQPTLLSNAETFAQLAVLAMLGQEGYASDGTPDEPGTVLLTVGGSAGRPAVVEVPAGIPLGTVLDICEATAREGVLVGGYHGMWIPGEIADDVPVSRAGLDAAGGALGAGIVMPLGGGTCPLGEVARIVRYLAKESSGQCGPCKLGLPGLARSMSALADGSGGVDTLDMARRAASVVRGRGACSHPDGVSRFVLSALDVFSDDLTAHLFRGSCGRPLRGILPIGPEESEVRLEVDWARCEGHGLCAKIAPEMVQLDNQGYPMFLDMPVPFWLEKEAQQAVEMCPALALRLSTGGSRVREAPRASAALTAKPTGLLLSSGSAREHREQKELPGPRR